MNKPAAFRPDIAGLRAWAVLLVLGWCVLPAADYQLLQSGQLL